MAVDISTRSLKPAVLVARVASQLSGIELAKTRLETGKSFLPENANPVYLKTPDYKKS